MQRLKEAIKRVTGHKVRYIFSYDLSPSGYVDYGTGSRTYSVKVADLEL